MTRVKRGVQSHRRHKTILERTKGHRGQRHRLIKRAHESMLHALRYNYVDRKDRKSDFRELWIIRINAAARLHELTYSRLIHGLSLAGIDLDRKALADLALTRPDAFEMIAGQAKAAIASGSQVADPRATGAAFTVTAGMGAVALAERPVAVATTEAEAAEDAVAETEEVAVGEADEVADDAAVDDADGDGEETAK